MAQEGDGYGCGFVLLILGGLAAYFFLPDFGSEYTGHYIRCEKPEGQSEWRQAEGGITGWGGAFKQSYRVSFRNQLVISEGLWPQDKCIVYDKDNWRCGEAPWANNGIIHPICNSFDGQKCNLYLGKLERLLLLLRMRNGNATCRASSGSLDTWSG